MSVPRVGLLLGILVWTSCATLRSRSGNPPRAVLQNPESCEAVYKHIALRDQFFIALRGKALAQTEELNLEIELAVVLPDLARLEFTGPLGIRVALLQLNSDWVQLYVPRENTVFRLPTSEFRKNTLRRQHFLELLPLHVLPQVFFDALLTRVSLPDKMQKVRCLYDAEKKAYALSLPEDIGGRLLWVDQENYVPLEAYYFDGALPELKDFSKKYRDKQIRPLLSVRHSELSGEGMASLPAKVDIYESEKKMLSFNWLLVESWPNYEEKTFQWRPSASMILKDY